LEFHIRKVNQTATGGSYVVIYEGELTWIEDEPRFEVQISRTDPQDADPALVEEARIAILSGLEEVLRPKGLGASLSVKRLVVHPTDFKAWRFKHHTAAELSRILDEAAGAR